MSEEMFRRICRKIEDMDSKMADAEKRLTRTADLMDKAAAKTEIRWIVLTCMMIAVMIGITLLILT